MRDAGRSLERSSPVARGVHRRWLRRRRTSLRPCARLLSLARQTNQPFDVLLTRFVQERLLYRLSLSRHVDRFVLKGAILLTTWLPETARGNTRP